MAVLPRLTLLAARGAREVPLLAGGNTALLFRFAAPEPLLSLDFRPELFLLEG